MNDLALTNVNSLWGYTLAETLVRRGVKQAVISPGSRSTPIIWALAHCDGLETIPLLDERGAAFFALGLARQSGRPVVLACTSGTAAANYLPAMVEAHESGTPLLVLTADRPPELRGCAAGQAVDQVKLYGSYVNTYIELPVPEATASCLRQLRETLSHALRRTMLPCRGPVHINCPLREPLAPQPGKKLALDFDPDALIAKVAPQNYAPPAPDATNLALPALVQRGLIVAGTLMTDDDAAARSALWSLAARTGWPVLAEALGPWRAGEVPENVTRISTYDAILADPAKRAALAPDTVLQIGPLPTSKNLRAFLAALDRPTLIATTGEDNINPLHTQAQVIQLAPGEIDLLSLPPASDKAYARLWADEETATRSRLNAALDKAPFLFEGRIARALFRTLPEGATLTIANSMSVRDAESFAECGHAPFRVHFSRGANGIDGTIAAALGATHGGKGVLLTGDLAFLYDASSLMAASQFKGHLTIVLVDNSGGGIFEKLPVASIPGPAFEKFFATPQNTDITHLAAAYGAAFEEIGTAEELSARLGSLPESGLRILRLKTDRKRDAAFRTALTNQSV
jgi:2-succinyl-5-enolpyruvyl-6-hydroxy-3-cyclohexene-1-carboxylate synthase